MIKLADILELIKFKVSLFVALASGAGYTLNGGRLDSYFFVLILLVFISSAGAAVVNEAIEFKEDSLMRRTCKRPICQGIVSKETGFLIGGFLTILALLFFWLFFNEQVALVSALTFALYNFIYTPLKKITVFAILIGTIPGALPVLGGALAASGSITAGALSLFAIMIFWQVLHFSGLAALYRDDYTRAGFKIGLDSQRLGFYKVFVPVSVFGFLLGNFSLVVSKPNFLGFFLIFMTQISSVVSIFYLLKNGNTESSVIAVKNLSLSLLCILIISLLV